MINDRIYSIKREKYTVKDKKITVCELVNVRNHETLVIEQKYRIKCKQIWAYVRHIGGREILSDEPIMYEGDIIFIINHRKGIVENQVILYNDVKYEITKVDYFEDYKSDIVIVGKSIN